MCFDELLRVRKNVLRPGMKFLIDRFLFSDQILNFSIMVHMFSTLILLPSNSNSAVDISVADISAADISVADISIVKISFYW